MPAAQRPARNRSRAEHRGLVIVLAGEQTVVKSGEQAARDVPQNRCVSVAPFAAGVVQGAAARGEVQPAERPVVGGAAERPVADRPAGDAVAAVGCPGEGRGARVGRAVPWRWRSGPGRRRSRRTGGRRRTIRTRGWSAHHWHTKPCRRVFATDHRLDWLTAVTEQTFFIRFLVQSALPTSQTATVRPVRSTSPRVRWPSSPRGCGAAGTAGRSGPALGPRCGSP